MVWNRLGTMYGIVGATQDASCNTKQLVNITTVQSKQSINSIKMTFIVDTTKAVVWRNLPRRNYLARITAEGHRHVYAPEP